MRTPLLTAITIWLAVWSYTMAAGPTTRPELARPLLDAIRGTRENRYNDSDIKKLRELLDQGADVNAGPDADDGSPLGEAAAWGRTDIALLLLERGADPNSANHAGCSALCLAALDSHVEIIKALLAKGAKTEPAGAIPLDVAVMYSSRKLEVVRLLLQGGAKVNFPNPRNGETALHLVAMGGKSEVIGILLANGADPNARDKKGHMPLDVARDEKTAALLRSAATQPAAK